jgi:nitroreductase
MPELHPLLAGRWSPRAFDPVAALSATELDALLEAARWAPSAADSQPWRFAVGLRHEERHKRILASLDPGEQRWAEAASALVATGHIGYDDRGHPLPRAAYDLGQAVAHLTVQATALGLYVRQVDHFDRDALRADLDVGPDVALLGVLAVGRLGDPRALPADLRGGELALRRRRPVEELLLTVG